MRRVHGLGSVAVLLTFSAAASGQLLGTQTEPKIGRLPDSPSGHIVFTKHVRRTTGLGTEVQVKRLYVCAGSGKHERALMPKTWRGQAKEAWWRPDMRQIVFSGMHKPAESLFLEDIFTADPNGGNVRQVTGRHAEKRGAFKPGYGTIYGALCDSLEMFNPAYGAKLAAAAAQIEIRVEGMKEKVFRPAKEVTDPETKRPTSLDDGLLFVIEKVPAGRVWVRCMVTKHTGHWVFVNVKKNTVNDCGVMDVAVGTISLGQPSVTPDGEFYVLTVWRNTWMRGVTDKVYAHWVRPPPPEGEVASIPVRLLRKHGVSQVRRGLFGIGDSTPELLARPVSWPSIAVFRRGRECQPLVLYTPKGEQTELAHSPRLSPDGRLVAFCKGNLGMESLAVLPLKALLTKKPTPRILRAGEMFPLHARTVGHAAPAFSPDGGKLAFVVYEVVGGRAHGDVCTMNLDGTGFQQVTRTRTNQGIGGVSWSPDGRRIAFNLITSRTQSLTLGHVVSPPGQMYTTDIYTIKADGADLKQITTDGLSSDPAWGGRMQAGARDDDDLVPIRLR